MKTIACINELRLSWGKRGDSMEPYLLCLLVLFPVILRFLSCKRLKLYFSPWLLVGPVAFLYLSLSSFLAGRPILLKLGSLSSNLSIGLELDPLSGLICFAVLTIGLFVIRFTVRYLEDDPLKGKFLNNLSLTLSSVLTMLLSPNLVFLFLSWVATSYFLHQLLIHFSTREGAQKAANQKFWVSRFGDVFILCSGIVLFGTFGTLDFDKIFLLAKDTAFVDQNSLAINLASILLVFGAMTKSAQYPFHYWLPNTMETPSPVSAIMHAGVINAGGYLIVRMSPLLSSAPASLSVLAVVGGFTAFYGSIKMITQTSIKKNLAYSTISQMGFMMLQCGLGAFSLAVVHIIGHAFYKAYAFLSSGSATDYGRLNRYFPKVPSGMSVWSPFIFSALSLCLVFGTMNAIGYPFLEKSGLTVLLVIFSLSIAQIFLSSENKMKAFMISTIMAGGYIALSAGMALVLGDSIPSDISHKGFWGQFSTIMCLGFFIALYLFQNNLQRISKTDFGKWLYVRSMSGGWQ